MNLTTYIVPDTFYIEYLNRPKGLVEEVLKLLRRGN